VSQRTLDKKISRNKIYSVTDRNGFDWSELFGALALLFWPLLLIVMLIARFASGRHKEPPSTKEHRLASAYFLFFPIFGILAVKGSSAFSHKPNDSNTWLICLGMMAVVWVFSSLWAKFVSAKITWTFAGIAWVVVIYVASRDNL
jgi:uncharacterized membrane protein HdeD (DUF308 family)